MLQPNIKISIIVCTRNRAYAIERCLDSIATALSVARIDAELLVVDNGSTDETAARVKAWGDGQSFPVRLLTEPRGGVCAAKNRGLREAQGTLVMFTDDDCHLSRTYFQDLLKHFQADKEPVLRSGRVELGDPSDLPLSIKTADTAQTWKKSEANARRINLGDSLMGGNLVMPLELARKLGPFDERFGPGTSIPGAEDTDYILRAYRAGLTLSYVPDMAVFHYHGRKRPCEGRQILQHYALGGGAIYTKYLFTSPDLCRQFYWDLKNAIKELLTGENTFMPGFGFSHKDKVFYTLLGAVKFFRSSVSQVFKDSVFANFSLQARDRAQIQ